MIFLIQEIFKKIGERDKLKRKFAFLPLLQPFIQYAYSLMRIGLHLNIFDIDHINPITMHKLYICIRNIKCSLIPSLTLDSLNDMRLPMRHS